MRQYIENAEYVTNYCVEESFISPQVRKIEIKLDEKIGEIYLTEIYQGVLIWVNDFYVKKFWMRKTEENRYLKLNYGLEGRCEVPLPDSRYVYVGRGDLSVDMNPASGWMVSPASRYEGLEIVIDLNAVRDGALSNWKEYGIDVAELADYLQKRNGSWLGKTDIQWEAAARKLAEHLKSGKGETADFRFCTLQLFYLMGKMLQREKGCVKSYLTKGQREMVLRIEKQLSEHLENSFSIEELAQMEGISASSLKKYFRMMYEKPISVYTRELKMKRAMERLQQTKRSISDIAMEVGYANPGKFGSAFRRYTKVTPLEYRRLNKTEVQIPK